MLTVRQVDEVLYASADPDMLEIHLSTATLSLVVRILVEQMLSVTQGMAVIIINISIGRIRSESDSKEDYLFVRHDVQQYGLVWSRQGRDLV